MNNLFKFCSLITFVLINVIHSIILPLNCYSQSSNNIEYDQNQSQMIQLLESFDSFKYSNIFILKLSSNNALKLNDIYGEPVPPVSPELSNILNNNSSAIKKNKEKTLKAFQDWLEAEEEEDKAKVKSSVPTSMIKYFDYLVRQDNYEKKKLNVGYIITNRFTGINDVRIIALMLLNSSDDEQSVATDLSTKQVLKLTVNLKNDKIEDKTVYDYLHNEVIQNNVSNVTLQAQGIDSESLEFLPKKYGSTYPINEDDIQQYLRISEGQPIDYNYEHEISIGLFDLVRYRYYGKLNSNSIPNQLSIISENGESQTTADSTSPTEADSTAILPEENKEVYNRYLPLFGAELRYGLPEINYPSLWSERVTLSVLWQSNKLGIILPTKGWSPLVSDLFNVERKLTNAGFGLYGSLDFPIKLLNQGGVFNVNASYVFGDAGVNPVSTSFIFQGRTADQLNDSSSFRNISISYLPRFHAQLHYSFAINIDNSSFFRFKLGATTFAIQRWIELEKPNGIDPQTNREVIEKKNRLSDQYSYEDLSRYNRLDGLSIAAISGLKPTELIAGLSGRIEYYTTSETVPWGFAMQYFDGSISGDLWLQVPIKDNFIFRTQAQFFQTVFRDPKPWELGTIVIPTMQFIYNF
jgi:hypothetical protein